MNIIQTSKNLIGSLKKYWKVPPSGRYMSYKEIFSLSVGGIGVKFIVYCVSNMILATGNTLIGNTIGIEPGRLYFIYLLSVLSGFPLTALRAKMIDNTRSMKGKYRPYILSMGIPTVILGIGFIWMPYENMSMTLKCVVVLLFNIGFQFFYNFMNDSYDSLINVLSPNTVERSDICSIKAVIENISPSIANILLPIAARLITGNNTLYDIKIYRTLYPPMLIIGFLISVIVYVNTEEKIVQAKTHIVQIKFSDALRAVAKNKYFWIVSLAGWLGFLEGSFNSILGWMYNYQNACTAAQYSLILAISGNASFWPNLVAPYFIRRYGKRAILISTNIMNIGFILMMLPIVRMTDSPHIIWILLIFLFINQFITSLGHLMNPSLNADIRDYQQYVTGERIDGMFAAVGLIGNVITLASSFVLPVLYKSAGLNETVAVSLGYNASNVYDVLYNPYYFSKICTMLIIASAVGAALNLIPFFFYDLTETKQRAMVTVLKIRALFEDYGNNALSDESLVEAIDIIEEAKSYAGKTPHRLDNSALKTAKKQKDKTAVKEARAALKEKRAENEKIEIAGYVLNELNRFNTPEGIAAVENAQRIFDAGLDGFLNLNIPSLREAKAMPKGSDFENELRRAAIDEARKIKTARKAATKHYSDGITEFDSGIFDSLFELEDKNEAMLRETALSLKAAKERKDGSAASLRSEFSRLQIEKMKIKRKIKSATDEYSNYNRAAKPYLDAKKLLTQRDNYTHYGDILARYEQSKLKAQN